MTTAVSYNGETFTLRIPHGFYYSTKEPVPVQSVINALQGLDAVIPFLPNMIDGMIGEVEFSDVRLFVDKIKSGSLIEDFFIDLVFNGPKGYEKFREKVRQLATVDDDEDKLMGELVKYALISVISAGTVYAVYGSESPAENIDVHHNTVINFGAGKFDFTPEQMAVVINAATGADKKKLAQSAIKIISPAKQDDEAELIIGGQQSIKFTSDMIEELPARYVAPVQDENVQDYSDVKLVIFASDKDKRGQGWAGIVPGVVDKRLLLKISDDLNPADLHGHVSVQADISVISRYSKAENKQVPYKILVKAFSI